MWKNKNILLWKTGQRNKKMIKRRNRWIINGADLSHILTDFSFNPHQSDGMFSILQWPRSPSDIWLQSSRQAGQVCAPLTAPWFISRLQPPSRPAEVERSEECNQWINFSSSFNWFLCLTPHWCWLVRGSCSPKLEKITISLSSPSLLT